MDSETEDEDADNESLIKEEKKSETLRDKFKSMNFVKRSISMSSQKKPDTGDFVLPGAKITAHATSIFQRMRAMDNINFD